ncbi:hypothetical protein Bbelb_281860 [Branchiostoma belcheri]|nr:hypothetical protein Bbelb_281860 [Branchiostoma belcheri]
MTSVLKEPLGFLTVIRRASGRDPTTAPPAFENNALPCRTPQGSLQDIPMPARLLNPAGASRGYIPDGHRRNWDLSLTGVTYPPPVELGGGKLLEPRTQPVPTTLN